MTGSGLILRENNNPIASINERTGVISLSGTGLSIGVKSATATEPTTLSIERAGKILYTQALALSDTASIVGVSSIAEAKSRISNGIGILPTDGYQVTRNAPNASSLPS